MKMNLPKSLKKNVIFIISVLLLSCLIVFISKSYFKPKTGFVEIKELYNNFNLKKELEKKFMEVKNARQKIMDSLLLDIKFTENKLKSDKKNNQVMVEFQNKKDFFLQKKQSFEEDNLKLSQQYDAEILSQLNQYVRNYGGEHHFEYIFGTDGNGFLMYAEESKNITKEMVEYINKNYQGKTEK